MVLHLPMQIFTPQKLSKISLVSWATSSGNICLAVVSFELDTQTFVNTVDGCLKPPSTHANTGVCWLLIVTVAVIVVVISTVMRLLLLVL